nr:putative branched-chain amino acid transport ATP-binding protein LivG [Candidatus Prometheoarchaeum syntrophicum]
MIFMIDNMLRIENLTVRVEDRQILKDFNLNINKGEVHVLLGPNGAGKTTLIKAILGYKNYIIESGKIYFKGKDITNLSISERVSQGIGVLFQRPPEINGVKLSKLLSVCDQKRNSFIHKTSENACDSDLDDYMNNLTKRVKFSDHFLERDVNTGFSGGEVKRSEILQMMVMQPDLLLFDEPDSGVDVENVELIASVMRELLDRDKVPSKQEKSGLIITHLGYILKFLGHITRAHILMHGKILCSGNPKQIINAVMKNGFEKCKECISCIDPIESFKEVDLTL